MFDSFVAPTIEGHTAMSEKSISVIMFKRLIAQYDFAELL